MLDDKDNVHWFVAKSAHAYTFDVALDDVSPQKKYGNPAQFHNMIFIDPDGGSKEHSGSFSGEIAKHTLAEFGQFLALSLRLNMHEKETFGFLKPSLHNQVDLMRITCGDICKNLLIQKYNR
ncbi:MAG: hypothetical protein K2Z81_22955 [Cyanobacteria bacterium]|nr:hypothetical protein [Cyanobacteriota bacterium]